MAKKLFLTLLIIFVFSTWNYAQEKTEPYLAHRGVEEHLSWWLNNGELLLDNVELVRNPETKVAIRVCTKLPLEKAIRQSKGAPYRIANYLTLNHGYTLDRVFILFFKECPAGEDKRISFSSDTPKDAKKDLDVEVWLVPKGAELPPADEIYKASEVKDWRFIKQ